MKKATKYLFATSMLLAAATASAKAQDYTMRIAVGASSKDFVCTDWFPAWGEKIKAESKGRINYQLFCDGTLGKMGDTVTRVEQGVGEVGWDIPLVYGQRFASFGLIGLPNLYDQPSAAAGAMWNTFQSGGIPPIKGLKLIAVQAFDNVSLWTTKEVPDISKLNGMKIGMGSKERSVMLQTMGGIPLALRVPEYYQSLAKGVADGVLTTDTTIFDFKMTELEKHNYRARFGGGVAIVVMNQQWYDALPDDLKKVIDQNSGLEASRTMSEGISKIARSALKTAEDKKAVAVHKLTDAELKAWLPAFNAATKSWTDAQPDGEKYLEAFKKELASFEAK
jgi:TRAP-type transport system periplasmic protein